MVLQRLEGCRTGKRSTGSPSTCAGGTPPGWPTRWRRGDGLVCVHGAGGVAGPAAPLGRPGSDLPGDLRRWPARPGWSGCGGCWTPRPWRTRSPPRTPSRCCGGRSGGCCGPVRPRWRPRSGRRCARDDDYITPGKPVCDWEDPAAREQLVDALVRDGYRAHGALRGERLDPRSPRRPSCWPPSSARTSRRPPTAASASSRGPRRIGSSPSSTPRPAMGTRPPPTALTATRAMWPSTLTARSSAPPRSARPPPATRWSRRRCWATWPQARVSRRPAGRAVVYGDSAYGTGAHLAWLDSTGLRRWSPPSSRPHLAGRFAKDQFRIDLQAQHGHLSGPGDRGDHPGPPRWWAGLVRCRVQRLPAAGCLHQQRPGAGGHHPSPRGRRWPPPAPASAIRCGGPTTERPDRRWNASWRTCCAAATAAGALACGGWCASPRTGSCWPARSTWPASPPSGCGPPAPVGRCSRPDGGWATLDGGCSTRRIPKRVREQRPPRGR